MTQVNKILKNLESKKLIKAVKSVAVSKHCFAVHIREKRGNDEFAKQEPNQTVKKKQKKQPKAVYGPSMNSEKCPTPPVCI